MINQGRYPIPGPIPRELNGIEKIFTRETMIKIEFKKWNHLFPKVR